MSLAKATRLASDSALARFRRSANAKPTTEKRRSTVAEVAGTPKYCRAVRARLGNFLDVICPPVDTIPARCAQNRYITRKTSRDRGDTLGLGRYTYIYGWGHHYPTAVNISTCMHGAAGKDLSRGSRAAAIFLVYLSRRPRGEYLKCY